VYVWSTTKLCHLLQSVSQSINESIMMICNLRSMLEAHIYACTGCMACVVNKLDMLCLIHRQGCHPCRSCSRLSACR
jgi:hypothetical protein